MTRDQLMANIKANITDNGNQEITGQVLQDTLVNMAQTSFDDIDEKIANTEAEVYEKIDNIEVSAYEHVSDDIAAVIPEFERIINSAIALDAETPLTPNGYVVYCNAEKAFLYNPNNSEGISPYYRYWPSFENYNNMIAIENTTTIRAIPNKLFKDSGGRAYIYDALTSTFSVLRPLQVVDTTGDSDDIPMSQASVTALYEAGYKFAGTVRLGETISLSDKKIFQIIEASGTYDIPSADDSGAITYSTMNLSTGTILAHTADGIWPFRISSDAGLSILRGDDSLGFAIANNTLNFHISSLYVINPGMSLVASQTFDQDVSMRLAPGTADALVLTGSISNQTASIIHRASWPTSIENPASEIPLLISKDGKIVGGALFADYMDFKVSQTQEMIAPLLDQGNSISFNGGQPVINANSYSALLLTAGNIVGDATLWLVINGHISSRGSTAKLLVVNETGYSVTMATSVNLNGAHATLRISQDAPESPLVIPSGTASLFEFTITPTYTGHAKIGLAFLSVKKWSL